MFFAALAIGECLTATAKIFALATLSGVRSACRLERCETPATILIMILERHPELQRLTSTEKLALVSELWDDLAAHPEEVPVAAELIAELDQRMAAYRKAPAQVTTWEAIKERILGSGTKAA